MATATSTRSPSPTPRNPDFAFSRKPESQYRTGFDSRRSRQASFEQKENAMIPNRTRSPSPSGKGTRNFMAPTISASSKRKILVDRNETLRSSTDSDVFTKPAMDFSPHVPKDSFRNVEETKNEDTSTLPLYDPNTNYLMPRPQFLHYRPNTRVEQYLDNEGDFAGISDGKSLEDGFSSEDSEETAEVFEEERSSELQKGCGDEIEESEVVESGHENLAIECETVGKFVDRSSELQKSCGDEIEESEVVKTVGKSVGKSCTCSRWKLVLIAVILAVAFVSGLLWTSLLVSESSVLKSRVLVDYPVYVKDIANRVKHWSGYIDSTAMQSKEFDPLSVANLSASMFEQTETIGYGYAEGRYGGTNEVIEMEQPVKEESLVDTGSFLELEVPVEVLENEQNEVEATEEFRYVADAELDEECFIELELPDEVLEVERNEAVVVEDFGDVVHVVLDVEKSEIGQPVGSFEGDRVMEYDTEKVYDQDVAAEIIQDETLQGSGAESHADISPDLASGIITEPKIVEVPEEIGNVNSGEETQLSDDGNSLPQPDGHDGGSVGGDLGSQEFVYHDLGRKPSSVVMLGTTISVLLLPAAAYLVYRFVNKRRASVVNTTVAEEATETQEKEAMSMSISGSSESYVLRKGSHFENTPAVHMANFSSPSKFMSTLQHSSSVGQGKETRSDMEEDSFSQERETRRDSTVSSVSYGSFTTYTKRFAKKKGLNEDEGLTPVRRSSRIRNKVTSP